MNIANDPRTPGDISSLRNPEKRSPDLGREVTVEIPESLHRWRADKAVHRCFAKLSRNQIQKLFEAGLVWRDAETLIKSDKVLCGDSITFTIPPEEPLEVSPVPIPLAVLFEDDDLIVVNKAPGMVVHPGAGTSNDTLVHALLHQCHGKLSTVGGAVRPGIVHRLDKETSGAIVAAKSDRAFLDLREQFSTRAVEKEYLALVDGLPAQSKGSIEEPIGRHPVHRMKMCIRADGRSASSEWNVEERLNNGFTLLRVRIQTGRTHQIRVHCSHLGMPLAGDTAYGFRARSEWARSIPRIMLHAKRLAFRHVATGNQITIEAPIPPDLEETLNQLRPHH